MPPPSSDIPSRSLVCKGPLDKHAPLPKVDVEVVVRHASDISGHLHGYEVARDMICCVSRGDEEEGRIVFVLARVESFAPRQYIYISLLVYSSKASAHASGASRARWRPLHARASRLGDRHLIWETDISTGRPTSRPTHHAGARREHFRWIQTSRECAG